MHPTPFTVAPPSNSGVEKNVMFHLKQKKLHKKLMYNEMRNCNENV